MAKGERTALYEDRLNPLERVATLALLLSITALCTLKTLFWLYQHEIWSESALRGLYAFTREWL